VDNRIVLGLGVVGLLAVILLNIFPFFWTANPAKFIEQDHVRGMALIHDGLPYTLNFDQQKKSIDILNRAIPVGTYHPTAADPAIDFTSLEIYPFEGETIHIKPVAWVEKNLIFSAPIWSVGTMQEVSEGELLGILDNAYDKNLPKKPAH
jgi:hypothetical protein